MSKAIITEQYLTDIANAIRSKSGTTNTYKPSEMATAINGIEAGGGNDELIKLIDGTITEVNLPTVEKCKDYCFSDCTNLTSIDFPLVTSLGKYCFSDCTKLTSINLPLVTSTGNYCFSDCTNLTSIDFPLVTSLGANCFSYCTNLTSINLPLVTSLGDYCFSGCSKLTSIDLPLVTSLGSRCFNYCSKLASVIIRTSQICPLSNSNAFTSTPIANGTGYIYVPNDLVESYKTATNWSVYASQFRAIEDYPEITGG